jgi:hypothetical protein
MRLKRDTDDISIDLFAAVSGDVQLILVKERQPRKCSGLRQVASVMAFSGRGVEIMRAVTTRKSEESDAGSN